MRWRENALAILIGVVAAASGGAAFADYDSDGRYVPSPMGVPTDPYARPVPLYPGTPGGAKGTPIWPRGALPPPLVIERRRIEPPSYPSGSQASRPKAPNWVERCRFGWTPTWGLSRHEFKRRCDGLARR